MANDPPIMDPRALGKAQTVRIHEERKAIKKALPELRDEWYGRIMNYHEERVMLGMYIENEQRQFEDRDGALLGEIRFLLTSGENVGSGLWTRYLHYCGLPERTARHRIQVAEGRYTKQVPATVAAVSLPEPEVSEQVASSVVQQPDPDMEEPKPAPAADGRVRVGADGRTDHVDTIGRKGRQPAPEPEEWDEEAEESGETDAELEASIARDRLWSQRHELTEPVGYLFFELAEWRGGVSPGHTKPITPESIAALAEFTVWYPEERDELLQTISWLKTLTADVEAALKTAQARKR